jgi:hypothetical protein
VIAVNGAILLSSQERDTLVKLIRREIRRLEHLGEEHGYSFGITVQSLERLAEKIEPGCLSETLWKRSEPTL